LGIVGRSFTYWASPETNTSKLPTIWVLNHQQQFKHVTYGSWRKS
jgi:hypothetical protein